MTNNSLQISTFITNTANFVVLKNEIELLLKVMIHEGFMCLTVLSLLFLLIFVLTTVDTLFLLFSHISILSFHFFALLFFIISLRYLILYDLSITLLNTSIQNTLVLYNTYNLFTNMLNCLNSVQAIKNKKLLFNI